jgi:hypothetical protein
MLTDKLMKDFQSITTLNFKILELWHSKTEKKRYMGRRYGYINDITVQTDWGFSKEFTGST